MACATTLEGAGQAMSPWYAAAYAVTQTIRNIQRASTTGRKVGMTSDRCGYSVFETRDRLPNRFVSALHQPAPWPLAACPYPP